MFMRNPIHVQTRTLISALILILAVNLCINFPFFAQGSDPDPKRFENEIDNFIRWDQKNSYPENAILFVGSSSIRLWPTAKSFPEKSVIKNGIKPSG